MKSKILGLLAVGLLVGPMVANAVVRTYDFTANGGLVGPLAGITSPGYFSFDESIIPPGGGVVDQVGLLTDLSFNWNGSSYDESNANTGRLSFDSFGNLVPQFFFGNNCGVGFCAVTAGFEEWLIYGAPTGNNVFAYSTGGVIYEGGTFTLSLRAPSVPEPGSLALLGLGLAGLGLSRRRKTH